MVQVRIRIEASTTVDPYLRYHGKAVNQALNTDFWDTQPEKVIGTTFNSFSHEQTVDLPAGRHYIIYGNSSIEGYEWHARIYVNDRLVAEGDVHRRRQLRADFTVEAPPVPMPSWTIPASIFLGIVTLAFSEAVK